MNSWGNLDAPKERTMKTDPFTIFAFLGMAGMAIGYGNRWKKDFKAAVYHVNNWLWRRKFILAMPYVDLNGDNKWKFYGSFRWRWMAFLYKYSLRLPRKSPVFVFRGGRLAYS